MSLGKTGVQGATGWELSILKVKGNCVSLRHVQATQSHASDLYSLCQFLFIDHLCVYINFNSSFTSLTHFRYSIVKHV